MGGALRIRGVAMRPCPVSIEDVSATVRVLMRNATICRRSESFDSLFDSFERVRACTQKIPLLEITAPFDPVLVIRCVETLTREVPLESSREACELRAARPATGQRTLWTERRGRAVRP